MNKIIYLTPQGQRKLEDALEYLCKVKRREVAQQLHEATEDGDDLDTFIIVSIC